MKTHFIPFFWVGEKGERATCNLHIKDDGLVKVTNRDSQRQLARWIKTLYHGWGVCLYRSYVGNLSTRGGGNQAMR